MDKFRSREMLLRTLGCDEIDRIPVFDIMQNIDLIEYLAGDRINTEDVSAVAIATERYDETGWWYLWYDFPETVSKYLDALTEYQLALGTVEEIKKATEQAIEDSGGAKTLIGSTSEIHPEIKVQNALAMYDTAGSFIRR